MTDISESSAQWVWTALLIPASLVFSLVFACATPFAAFAALAAIYFGRKEAAILILGVWLINQLVGYGFLGYPTTWDSFGWGAAIGIAALAAMAVAIVAFRYSDGAPLPLRWLVPFLAAFAVYELVLWASTLVLPSGDDAFSLQMVSRILGVNVMAYGGLLGVQQAALVLGLAAPSERQPARLR